MCANVAVVVGSGRWRQVGVGEGRLAIESFRAAHGHDTVVQFVFVGEICASLEAHVHQIIVVTKQSWIYTRDDDRSFSLLPRLSPKF